MTQDIPKKNSQRKFSKMADIFKMAFVLSCIKICLVTVISYRAHFWVVQYFSGVGKRYFFIVSFRFVS
jgi:hypothetical protein